MATKRILLLTSFFLAFGCLLALPAASAERGWQLRLGSGATSGDMSVDVPFGKNGWSFCTAIRYFEADLEATAEDGDRTAFAYDPINVGVGFGYRF